jgi:hypothetical protein
MSCRCALRLLVCLALLVLVLPVSVAAQDDPNEVPLGDVARNIRKKMPTPIKPVIDDDNLPEVMRQADQRHESGSGLRFLMSSEKRGFQMQAPDVTCSLSFSASVKSLLRPQYDQMELPASELAKIEAKAVIEGDALTVPLFNGTQWNLSELAVAVTVVRKMGAGFGTLESNADAFEQVRPEKKPDHTLIYRMRAAGGPWQRSTFSAPLNLDIGPEDEWHWAIVQAKGYPPEANPARDARGLFQSSDRNAMPTTHPASLTTAGQHPEDSQKASQ